MNSPTPKRSRFEHGIDTSKPENATLFIGLGAMKSGTSWLASYLAQHPDVFMSPIKEMNFFASMGEPELRRISRQGLTKKLSKIVLRRAWQYPPSEDDYEMIKAAVEIANFNQSRRRYLAYFARRMGEERVFGEFSPVYSRLPPQLIAEMCQTTRDVRFAFIMREPTDRAISNIRHVIKNSNDQSVDGLIDQLMPGNPIYEKSNYPRILETIQEGAPNTPLLKLYFDDLFTETSARKLCEFLDIPYLRPDFELKVNASLHKAPVSEDQQRRIREKLAPIYEAIEESRAITMPAAWRRQANCTA